MVSPVKNRKQIILERNFWFYQFQRLHQWPELIDQAWAPSFFGGDYQSSAWRLGAEWKGLCLTICSGSSYFLIVLFAVRLCRLSESVTSTILDRHVVLILTHGPWPWNVTFFQKCQYFSIWVLWDCNFEKLLKYFQILRICDSWITVNFEKFPKFKKISILPLVLNFQFDDIYPFLNFYC